MKNRHMRRREASMTGRLLLRATNKEGDASMLSPGAMLSLLLIKHMGGKWVEEDHLADLVEEAIAHCGSVENAIAALEAGRLNLEQVP
jgi:hypothetical protein